MSPAAPLTRQFHYARPRWQMHLVLLALALLAPRSVTSVAWRTEFTLPGGRCAPVCAPQWRGDVGVTSILGIRG